MAPLLVLIPLLIFSLFYLAPGDPAQIIAGDQATPADIVRIRMTLQLEQPFLVRFSSWYWHVLHGDLGRSLFTNLPVLAMIRERIEPTLSLMAAAILLGGPAAILLGVVAAARAGSWTERLLLSWAVVGFSLPSFAVGYSLAWLLALQLGFLPAQGYSPFAGGISDWLRSLLMPGLVLSINYGALLMRITYAAMREEIGQPYMTAALGKGLTTTRLLFVHALKNAAGPIITTAAFGIAMLIGGAVVTETVFSLPGIGGLLVDAILQRDYPVIQGVTLLVSIAYVLINLVVDLLQYALDPRIRPTVR